jgi:2-dehydro-3-deoxy-D-gluconate 5-dehydrogenase
MSAAPLVPFSDLLDLRDKVAVVTGGAAGIGLAIATRLAEAGAAVTIADRDDETAAVAVKELTERGYDVAAVTGDIADPADVARVFERAGDVDILVNNAGIYPFRPVLDMAPEDFERVLRVNLEGVFLCSQHAARLMVARGRGGRIINVTSIDALHPSSLGLAHYDASKHGVWGFTKNLALELAPHRIWVNAIAPGGIATPGTTAAPGSDAAAVAAEFATRIPMGRMGDPDDIGKVALFLASDLASYLTGSQIVVDGGVLLK